jgi:hypothetical protein
MGVVKAFVRRVVASVDGQISDLRRSRRLGFLAWCAGFVVWGPLLFSTAHADSIRVSGGIFNFTGVVTDQTYVLVNPSSGPAGGCGTGGQCPTDPLANWTQLCPDAGCAASPGIATNFPLDDPNDQTGTVVDFAALFNYPGNQLIWDPAGLETADVNGEFKLGTLTFTNGLWTGDADFGLNIDVHDSTNDKDYDFSGYVHMGLTPNSSLNTPAENADYIYLTDASHNPLEDPLTLDPIGSFRVYELTDSPTGTNSGTVDLYGTVDGLDPTRFENPTGAGFLNPSVTNSLAPVAVPEPASAASFGAGLLFLAIACALRRRVCSRPLGGRSAPMVPLA